MLIAGDGPERSRCESLVERIGLSDRVTFTGRIGIDALDALLGMSSLGLAPYRSVSGIGNKFGEYFAYGLPVVTNLTGEIARLIQDRECGAMYNAGDAESMATALDTYLSQPTLIDAHGANARAVHEDYFSVERAGEAFEVSLRLAVSLRERGSA
jgi:glycosyltransferase involved in cell wall biosynthesis